MMPSPTTRPLAAADLTALSALHARVFGPGRFTRSAYRVREGTPLISRFCRGTFRDGHLIAALRMTEVVIGGNGAALLLGPLAVAPAFAGQGFGRALIAETLETARTQGVRLVVLVGDLPYYGRFGFRPIPEGQIVLPGPVNPARLLAVELEPGALAAYRGVVGKARLGNRE